MTRPRGQSALKLMAALRALRQAPLLIKVAIVAVIAIVLAGVLAPLISPYGLTEQHLLSRLQPPGSTTGQGTNLLGTDELGRDVLTRVLYSIRTSIGIAALAMVMSLLVGVTLGLAAGLLGGWVDDVVMFLVDVQLSVPYMLIALVAVSVFGTGLQVLIVVMGIARWETYARLTRGQVLLVKEQAFSEAARALGASVFGLAVRHTLPNISSPLLILATANLSSIILLESSLSFLGVGVQPPDVSLGLLISSGRDYLMSAWWLTVAPSVVLVLLIMGISLLGDWVRDVLDPRTQGR